MRSCTYAPLAPAMSSKGKYAKVVDLADDEVLSGLLRLLRSGGVGLEVYVSYDPITHPIATVRLMPSMASEEAGGLNDLVGEVVLEVTLHVDALAGGVEREGVDLGSLVLSFKVRCKEGFLVYSYVTARDEQGVPHIVRDWVFLELGRYAAERVSLDEGSERVVTEVLKHTLRLAHEVAKQEGLL